MSVSIPPLIHIDKRIEGDFFLWIIIAFQSFGLTVELHPGERVIMPITWIVE